MGSAVSTAIKICPILDHLNKDRQIDSSETKHKENKENTSTEAHNQNKKTAAWNYCDDDFECGPCNWPVPAAIRYGKQQSPIDLQLSQMITQTIKNDPLKFVNYSLPLSGKFVNNGYSVQFVPDTNINPVQIYGGMLKQSYRLIQYHYHWAQDNNGSEHTFGGLHYPAELHMVHQGIDDPTQLAVLGIFLNVEKSSTGVVFEPEEKALPKLTECNTTTLAKPQKLELKLPKNSAFIRYNGSLTTPPCTENVTWTVFTDPITISPEQIKLLRNVKGHDDCVIAKNCRPVQSVHDRLVTLVL